MEPEIEGVRDSLLRLTRVPRVTGIERNVVPVLRKLMSPFSDAFKVDAWGNSEAIINPGGKPVVMLAAHVDQIGIIVREVTEDGFVKFEGVGWDAKVLYGMRVKLLTDKGEVKGVVSVLPPHIFRTYKELAEKKLEVRDLAIDIGADSKEDAERAGIKPGVYGVPDYEPEDLLGHHFSSPGLDDAAGVVTMIEALKLAWKSRDRIDAEVHFVATIQEEIGLRGAEMVAYRLKPDIAVAIDVTFAKQPMMPAEFVLRTGKGPAISKGPIYHWEVVEALERAAKEAEIPYQIEPDFRGYGTDTWAIQVARGGVRTGLISIPLRSMHSPVEVVNLNDIAWGGALLSEFIKML
ncbi:MAG: M20/M25/M40 family metallo-hydrolase [Candidatus Korarchaeota archaeon]|nr:M20/M25/M40 family metallo-hydrolase [Candidatus Korarchaeota archaeon]